MPEYRLHDSMSISYSNFATYYKTIDKFTSIQISYDSSKIKKNLDGSIETLSNNKVYWSNSDILYKSNLLLNVSLNQNGKERETIGLNFKMPEDGTMELSDNGAVIQYDVVSNLQITFGFFIESNATHNINFNAIYLHSYREIDWDTVKKALINIGVGIASAAFPPTNIASGVLYVYSAGSTIYGTVTSDYKKDVFSSVGKTMSGNFYITKYK